jgi:hypothetical protein
MMNIPLKNSDENGMKPELSFQTKAAGTRSVLPSSLSKLADKRKTVLALALAVLSGAGCGSSGSSADAGGNFSKSDAMADARSIDSRAADSGTESGAAEEAGNACPPGTTTGNGVFGCGPGPADAGHDAPADTNIPETSKESGPADTGIPDAPRASDAVNDSANPDAGPPCDTTGSFELAPDMGEYVYADVRADGSIVPFPESTRDGTYSTGKCGNSPVAGQHEEIWSPTGIIKFTTPISTPTLYFVNCVSYSLANPPTLAEMHDDLSADGGFLAPSLDHTGQNYTVDATFCPNGAEFWIGY